jgi:hypothetical protein
MQYLSTFAESIFPSYLDENFISEHGYGIPTIEQQQHDYGYYYSALVDGDINGDINHNGDIETRPPETVREFSVYYQKVIHQRVKVVVGLLLVVCGLVCFLIASPVVASLVQVVIVFLANWGE